MLKILFGERTGKLSRSAGRADSLLLPRTLPSGHLAASSSPIFPPRQRLGAGLNPAEPLTLGTCCLLLSTSCLTQLSTARYTSSSDGTLRLSLEMRSSTCREGWKRQIAAGTAWDQGIYSHRWVNSQQNSTGRGREWPPAGADGQRVHSHWMKDPKDLAARVRSQLCPQPPSSARFPSPLFCV